MSLGRDETRIQVSYYTAVQPLSSWGRTFQSTRNVNTLRSGNVVLSVESICNLADDVYNWLSNSYLLNIENHKAKPSIIIVVEYATQKEYKLLCNNQYSFHQFQTNRNNYKLELVKRLIDVLLK